MTTWHFWERKIRLTRRLFRSDIKVHNLTRQEILQILYSKYRSRAYYSFYFIIYITISDISINPRVTTIVYIQLQIYLYADKFISVVWNSNCIEDWMHNKQENTLLFLIASIYCLFILDNETRTLCCRFVTVNKPLYS